MKRLLVLLTLTLSGPAHADTLGDVKAALLTFSARQAVRATYESHRTNAARGRFYDNDYNAAVSAEARVDADGVTITYARPLLNRARAEHTARLGSGPKHDPKTPTVADVSPVRIAEMLDFAPSLAAMLELAEIVEERQTIHHGQPAHLVVFKLTDHADSVKEGRVKTHGNRMTLWLGADHVPLAAQRVATFTAGILFLHADGAVNESWTFARRDDRLVVARYERNDSSSGMGETSQGTTVETIALR